MRFYTPTSGPDDWRPLLGKPELHWVKGRSAWEAAHRWERAGGFPSAVAAVLDASGLPELVGLEPILGLPEFETPLPGGDRASQTDLLVLARNDAGLAVIAVEAKVDETFGPLVSEWEPGSTSGKSTRFAFLCELLDLDPLKAGTLRYQLLHRTAASVLEARRFSATTSVMLVHSFSPMHAGFADYAAFVKALGGEAALESVTQLRAGTYAGWVTDTVAE